MWSRGQGSLLASAHCCKTLHHCRVPDDCDHTCDGDFCRNSNPYQFAFGQSKLVREKDIAGVINPQRFTAEFSATWSS